MLKTQNSTRHWLDRAKPKYWKRRECWRVRVMRDGQKFQWILTTGKGDSGSTGRFLAMSEWNRLRQKLIDAEQPEYDESGMFINFRSPEEEADHYRFYNDRDDYKASALSAEMSFEEWQEWREFKEWKASQKYKALGQDDGMPKGLPDPIGQKPLTDLTGAFREHLKHRLKNTKPGLKDDDDLSEARFKQHEFALAHFEKIEGTTPIKPIGKFHIGEEQLSQILAHYRQKCKDEMSEKEWTGWWFNERMKTARTFVEYIATERWLSARPPNLAKLVQKFDIEENPLPVSLPALRAIWQVADEKFQGFMLLALNCGFRQTEIFNLDRPHMKVIAGVTCVSKLRGKTGIELAIPLWASTQRFIAKYGEAKGRLFPFWKTADDAMHELYYEFKKYREKVGETLKEALDYSFQNLRDTGASYIESRNPMLKPFYLGQKEAGQAKRYVAPIKDEQGKVIVPMDLDTVLAGFETYLGLPAYEP